MKKTEKDLARKLRLKGFSINEICLSLSLPKSTVSLWVRDIELTASQKITLSLKGVRKEIIEKRRLTRLTRENARRDIITQQAQKAVHSLSRNDLFLIGIALYWAEGSKTRRGIVEFCNSDPKLIRIMLRFFREICKVPKEKFRGHIHLHPHLSSKKAELYWHQQSGIPLSQFFKTSQQHNKASKGKKDSLPYGTFSIYVCSTELFLKIRGWMNGLYESITSIA